MPQPEAVSLDRIQELFSNGNELIEAFHSCTEDAVWARLIDKVRNIYDCELASLFVVSDDNPNQLVLKSQVGSTSLADSNERINIESRKGGGITAHVAATKQALSLDRQSLSSSPWVSRDLPTFHSSSEYYSALLIPLLSRKQQLLGVLRLHNRDCSHRGRRSAFTAMDMQQMKLFGTHLASIAEHLRLAVAIRCMMNKLEQSQHVDEILQCLVTTAKRLVMADRVALALPSHESPSHLTWRAVSSATNAVVIGQLVDDDLLNRHWTQARFSSTASQSLEIDDILVRIRHPQAADTPSAPAKISFLLGSKREPLGLLLIACDGNNEFDEMDKSWMRQLVSNFVTAVQKMHDSLRAAIQPKETKDQLDLRLLMSVLEHTPMVMWRKDIEGKYTWVNQRFCESVGLRSENIVGQADAQIFSAHPDLVEKYRRGDLAAMDDGSFEDLREPYYQPRSTELRFIHVRKTATRDVSGRITGTQGAFFDVTSDRYRDLFHKAPVGFHEINGQGQIVDMNDYELALLGHTSADEINCQFTDLVLDADREIVNSYLDSVRRSELSNVNPDDRLPVNLVRKDGTSVPVQLTIRRMSAADAPRPVLLCVVNEIDGGRIIEEELKKPDDEYLEEMFKLKLPAFRLDRNLKIAEYNDAYKRFEKLLKPDQRLGQTSVEIYGQRLGAMYDEDNKRVIEQHQVLDKFEPHQDVKPGRDASESVVRVLKFPLLNQDKTCRGLQCVFWLFKENEDALRQLRKAYHESLINRSLKTRDATLRMLSHQLRSPIWQAFERVKREVEQLDPGNVKLSSNNASPELRRLAIIRGLNRKARRVAWNIDMLWRLAESSDIERRHQVVLNPRRLLKLAREAAVDLKFIHQRSHPRDGQGTAQASIDFSAELEEHYWDARRRMRVDEALVEQVVGNIMDNAFKYSLTNSRIRIICRVGNTNVRLIVRNQSPPALAVNQIVLDNCRRKDWRAPAAAAVDADGTGLGLWIVDRIMKAHDGELQIQLTDAEGWNEFALQFPLK